MGLSCLDPYLNTCAHVSGLNRTHVVSQDDTSGLMVFRERFLGHEVTPRLLTRNGIRYTLPQSRPMIASVNLLGEAKSAISKIWKEGSADCVLVIQLLKMEYSCFRSRISKTRPIGNSEAEDWRTMLRLLELFTASQVLEQFIHPSALYRRPSAVFQGRLKSTIGWKNHLNHAVVGARTRHEST